MPQSFKAFHLGENHIGSRWQKKTITIGAKIDERAATQIDERGALYVFLHYQRANRESSSEHGIVGRCCSGSFSSSNLGRNSWFVHYWVCTKELKSPKRKSSSNPPQQTLGHERPKISHALHSLQKRIKIHKSSSPNPPPPNPRTWKTPKISHLEHLLGRQGG